MLAPHWLTLADATGESDRPLACGPFVPDVAVSLPFITLRRWFLSSCGGSRVVGGVPA
jgi:hypothetical protein